MSKRNIVLIAVGVVGVITLIAVSIMVFSTMRGKDQELEELALTVEDLEWQVSAFGDVVEVYTVAVEKKSGSVFDQSDIDVMPIPSSQLTDQYITNIDDLRNCIYKIDVEPGMPLMKGLFFREVLSQTDRYHDVVADLFPVGARTGDYYDLRLVTPNGLDYIVLSKKRAVDYYGSAVRFVLSEEELHQYQSALVDVFINPGTYLYVATYVEPAMQKRASIYYPVSDIVMAIMEIDPNIVQLAEKDLIARRRAMFEQGLEIDEDSNKAIVAGRTEQISRIVSAAQARLQANPITEEPSDGSDDKSGAVDVGSGNLMSPNSTETNETTEATDRTEKQMQFDQTPQIAPEGLQEGITGPEGGW